MIIQFTLLEHIDNDDDEMMMMMSWWWWDDYDDIISKQKLDFDTKEKILRGISMIRKHYPLLIGTGLISKKWWLFRKLLWLFDLSS